ncbi:WD40-repeat-containing domain protein [Lipomyces oligophaga]|uniref:WD40-repeat-containing domain protein n=1 Tax=Lipomyces oligophaga TaxID=45792 RepID=UPI0034CF8A8E
MAAPRNRVQIIRDPVLPSRTTPEQRFWRSYRTPLLIKEHGAITHINFCPTAPYDFAVTSGTRVQIFSSRTRQVDRTIARFKDTVYSGEFRSDGKLLVAGDATGTVQIFDSSTRAILISLTPTSLATHVTKFHPKQLTTLLSASDDRIVRIFDITSPDPIASFGEHSDYVRAAAFLSPASDTIVSGSYDGQVRLFDPRTPGAVQTLDNGSPVEAVLPLSSTTVLSSGGPSIKVWDLVSGKIVRELVNFQKTVTSLCLGGDSGNPSGQNTVLAGALDGHVKVFDTTSWDVKFGWKFGSNVLATAISPNQKHFATGLSSGVLSIRTKKTEAKVKQGVKKRDERTSAAKPATRGLDYKGEQEHEIIVNDTRDQRRKRKIPQWERHLNAFRWSSALDAALQPGVTPEVSMTVLRELVLRGKVQISLAGRDESQLEALVKWAFKNIDDFRNVAIVADWIACMIDMYGQLIERSPVLEDQIGKFGKKVDRQVQLAKEARKLEGMLEMLIHSH